MYYLEPNDTGPGILLVGGGSVGSAIRDNFLKFGYYQYDTFAIKWDADNDFNLSQILSFTSSSLGAVEAHKNKQKILIWAAGAAGFDVSEEQAKDDQRQYAGEGEFHQDGRLRRGQASFDAASFNGRNCWEIVRSSPPSHSSPWDPPSGRPPNESPQT